MNGWIGAVVFLALALNPPLLSWTVGWPERVSTAWRRVLGLAALAGAAVWVAVVISIDPILDAIDVSPPTFRLGAAVVVGIGGLLAFATTRPQVHDEPSQRDGALLVGAVYLLAPGPVFAAAAGSAEAGVGPGLLAVAVALVLSAVALVAPRGDTTTGPALVRLTGAATVIAAVAVGLDAARTV